MSIEKLKNFIKDNPCHSNEKQVKNFNIDHHEIAVDYLAKMIFILCTIMKILKWECI